MTVVGRTRYLKMAAHGQKTRKRHPDTSGENSVDIGARDVPNDGNYSTNAAPNFRQENVFQNSDPTTYKTAAEYSHAVQKWLWQYHMWNQMNWFYMNLSMNSCNYGRFPPTQGSFPNVAPTTNDNSNVVRPNAGVTGNQNHRGAAGPATNIRQVNTQQAQANVQRGQEFRVPPLWKRVFAEFIDFFLLFIVKLAVTIFFVEYIGLVDLRHYDLEYLMTTDMDYNTAFAMTSELVAMEIVNRVFICIFETLCLRRGFAGTAGGTTPGKRLMGLKVISCMEISDLPGHRIRVTPAGNIGTWNAFVRSLIKNFSLAFFFPVCLTVFFFQHNRAAYDIIANCVVVEAHDLPDRQWR